MKTDTWARFSVCKERNIQQGQISTIIGRDDQLTHKNCQIVINSLDYFTKKNTKHQQENAKLTEQEQIHTWIYI